jgi:hypothetical protein
MMQCRENLRNEISKLRATGKTQSATSEHHWSLTNSDSKANFMHGKKLSGHQNQQKEKKKPRAAKSAS